MSTDACNLADDCPMRGSWAHSQEILNEELQATTFENLARVE